jgi:hypothetical protein
MSALYKLLLSAALLLCSATSLSAQSVRVDLPLIADNFAATVMQNYLEMGYSTSYNEFWYGTITARPIRDNGCT